MFLSSVSRSFVALSFLKSFLGVALLSTLACPAPNTNPNPDGGLPTIPNSSNADFNTSAAAWNEAREASGNSYTYVVTTSSFSGFSTKTTLVITNDVVTERHYEERNIPEGSPNGVAEITATYDEVGVENVGDDERGADPLLMEDLYVDCAESVAVNTDDNNIFFETFDGETTLGVVKLCGFVPKNCLDDCFQGFSLESLVFAQE